MGLLGVWALFGLGVYGFGFEGFEVWEFAVASECGLSSLTKPIVVCELRESPGAGKKPEEQPPSHTLNP